MPLPMRANTWHSMAMVSPTQWQPKRQVTTANHNPGIHGHPNSDFPCIPWHHGIACLACWKMKNVGREGRCLDNGMARELGSLIDLPSKSSAIPIIYVGVLEYTGTVLNTHARACMYSEYSYSTCIIVVSTVCSLLDYYYIYHCFVRALLRVPLGKT